MRRLFSQMWREQDGVLSFEWTMLASLLTVGVVAGMAAVRDGVIDEMGDLTRSMTSLDQSYRIQPPLVMSVHTLNSGSGYSGSYHVYNFRGRRTTSRAQGAGVLGYDGSTAAGSLFIDSAPPIVRSRLPDDRTAPPAGAEVPAQNEDQESEATGNILEQ